MGKYALTSKISNEVINTTKANCFETAVEYFASVKQLSIDALLNIFLVVKIEN